MACLSRIIRFSQLKPAITTLSRCLSTVDKTPSLQTIPRVLFNPNPWIWQKNDQIKLPILNKIQIDLPNGLKWVPPLEDPLVHKEIELPTTVNSDVAKEAVRLIVIRRKKMKRHKLKKLRKKMKFVWAKIRQRRELKKEKDFQAVLIKQCKDAEDFSAERYVEERLAKFVELNTPVIREVRKRPPMVWPPPKP